MHSPRDRIVGIDNAPTSTRRRGTEELHLPRSGGPPALPQGGFTLCRRHDRRLVPALLDIYEKSRSPCRRRPTTVTVRTGTDGFRTEMFVRGQSLVADEPSLARGRDRRPTITCWLGSLHQHDRADVRPPEEVAPEAAVVRLDHRKVHAEDQAHYEELVLIDRFERELDLIGPLSDEQRRRLLEIAEKCPVHRTLEGEPVIETRLREESTEMP